MSLRLWSLSIFIITILIDFSYEKVNFDALKLLKRFLTVFQCLHSTSDSTFPTSNSSSIQNTWICPLTCQYTREIVKNTRSTSFRKQKFKYFRTFQDFTWLFKVFERILNLMSPFYRFNFTPKTWRPKKLWRIVPLISVTWKKSYTIMSFYIRCWLISWKI